jgi:hypothetical protein
MGSVPNGKPRVLMRALLQMTMATDDATESVRDPNTPSWKPPAVIVPNSCICYLKLHISTKSVCDRL